MDGENKKLFDLGFVKIFVYFWCITILIWVLIIKITVKSKQKKNVKIWIEHLVRYLEKVKISKRVQEVMIRLNKSTKLPLN